MIISLNDFRREKSEKKLRASKSACALFNSMDAVKLSKLCVHCKFQGGEYCPKTEGQVGLVTQILPFRVEKASVL